MDEVKLRKLRQQISYWLDGALSPDEVRALENELKSSSAARREYLHLAAVHADLCQSATGEELLHELNVNKFAAAPITTTRDSSAPEQPTVNIGGFARWAALATAVGLLFAIVSIGRWQVLENRTDRDTPHGNAAQGILASVAPAADDCRWYVEETGRDSAQSFRAGDVIRVSSGRLLLKYANGTRVVLRSPAAYQLISASSARMIIGRLTATVAESGKGFTIITPQADVIDLGTEFGVEVNEDGATDVVVFKGEVDLDYHRREKHGQRLRMGEAVRLDAVGTTSRLVWVNEESYYDDDSTTKKCQPLIVEVRDNIERDSSMFSFYKIVTCGMKEDAVAYVDRIAHEYNGVTPSGMPSYLVNADYVKMFNNDKFNKTTHVEVTLSEPAKLYVLLDNRHTPPQWLTEGFQDTGDDIGLDNGPFQTVGPTWHNKGPSGVGPGESVDDQMSVWVKEVPAGVVHLGPMGTSVEVGANMYGIAATPLE